MAATTSSAIALNPRDWLDDPGTVIGRITAGGGDALRIDATDVTEVPALVAQMLLSSKAWAEAKGLRFELESVGEELAGTFSALGLDELLGGACR